MRDVRRQMAKAANAERQKKMEDDTARLLVLVNQLQGNVSSDQLTAKSTADNDAAKKVVEEIEKLAQQVKEKMKE